MGKGVSGGGNMNCGEFQESLAYIIDTGGNAKQKEHLKECSVCSDLVSDLRYIADQAKLLVPMLEPSSRVWDGIKTSLEQEGVVKNRTARGRLLGILPASRWGPGTRGSGIWMLPIAALVLVAVGLLAYRSTLSSRQTASAELSSSDSALNLTNVVSEAMSDNQDQQLLAAIAARAPEMRQSYEQDLRNVNAYISDERKSVDTDPDDEDARQALNEAYREKAMLYEIAVQHSQP